MFRSRLFSRSNVWAKLFALGLTVTVVAALPVDTSFARRGGGGGGMRGGGGGGMRGGGMREPGPMGNGYHPQPGISTYGR